MIISNWLLINQGCLFIAEQIVTRLILRNREQTESAAGAKEKPLNFANFSSAGNIEDLYFLLVIQVECPFCLACIKFLLIFFLQKIGEEMEEL